jgi:hypothetical protein
MRCRKAQVARDPRNVSDKPEFGAVPHPTDRPHLAVFILPSSVARPQRPIPELQASKNAQWDTTRCTFRHRNKSSHD